MIASIEHSTVSAERAMHCMSQPLADGLHAPTERLLPGGLDDQVRVIPLHGVMHDAELPALASLPQARSELAEERASAQRAQSRADAQRDMAGIVPADSRALDVVDARAWSWRSARPRARSPATAAHSEVAEAQLSGRRHGFEYGLFIDDVNSPASTHGAGEPQMTMASKVL